MQLLSPLVRLLCKHNELLEDPVYTELRNKDLISKTNDTPEKWANFYSYVTPSLVH